MARTKRFVIISLLLCSVSQARDARPGIRWCAMPAGSIKKSFRVYDVFIIAINVDPIGIGHALDAA